MQIDFHHGTTYCLARLAGFNHAEAEIIAYCAQYVDDATNAGLIVFDNGALFNRISSAHKMLDYRNFGQLANHQVWIPFHFLPGNGGLSAGQDPNGKFIEKLICRPNSPVAQDLVKDCILNRHLPYGLHRLGITMHVYADTWAHQGFAGVNHPVNAARNLVDEAGRPDTRLINRLQNYFVNEALPLGHGTVLSNPDKPFLRWGYTNGRGEKITRNNPQDFLEAANCMYQWLKRYRLGDPTAEVAGLPAADQAAIAAMFTTITDDKGRDRHQKWLQAIAEGYFRFGPAQLTYIPKGKNSWKYLALGTESEVDREKETFHYQPEFLVSDWKRFHSALQAHYFYVIHNLLPSYGICAA